MRVTLIVSGGGRRLYQSTSKPISIRYVCYNHLAGFLISEKPRSCFKSQKGSDRLQYFRLQQQLDCIQNIGTLYILMAVALVEKKL